jgi:hypothetical protein
LNSVCRTVLPGTDNAQSFSSHALNGYTGAQLLLKEILTELPSFVTPIHFWVLYLVKLIDKEKKGGWVYSVAL